MANIELQQFWETLEASNLLGGLDLSSMQSRMNGFSDDPETAARRVARWMTEQNLITQYQSEILLTGHSGPFQFGNYMIQQAVGVEYLPISAPKKSVDQESNSTMGAQPKTFLALHKKSRFPVCLHFSDGEEADDLSCWNQLESLTNQASMVRHPSLVSVFEPVVMPKHRFIVTAKLDGAKLSGKLPHKSRLPLDKTFRLMSRVAAGLASLHENDLWHGNLSFDHVWIGGSNKTQVLLPVTNSEFRVRPVKRKAGVAKDVVDVGKLMFRTITGRSIEDNPDAMALSQKKFAKALERFKVQPNVSNLVFDALHFDEASESVSMGMIREQLEKLAGEKVESGYVPSEPEVEYQTLLNEWLPMATSIASVPAIDTESGQGVSTSALQQDGSQQAQKILSAVEAAQQRKKSKWKIPATIAATLLAFAGVLGVWAFMANQKMLPVPTETVAVNNTTENVENVESVGPDAVASANSESKSKIWLLQDLIADDSKSLWESPTSGPALSLDYLPNAPQMIAAINFGTLLGTEEGQQILDALGPDFRTRLSAFESRAGFSADQISQVTLSLHSNDQLQYEPFAVVTLETETPLAGCLTNWGQPESQSLVRNKTIYAKNDLAFWVINEPALPALGSTASEGENVKDKLPDETEATVENPESENSNDRRTEDENNIESTAPKNVKRFIVGPREWVEQVALGEATPVGGALNRLALNSDRSRHINLLFLRPALFNDEGKDLMGTWATFLQPELRLLIPDEIRAAQISLHVDNGNYLELKLDHQLDIKPEALIEKTKSRLIEQRDSVGKLVTSLSTNPYWDQVRNRYDSMLSNLTDQWRWDVEFEDVVANAWLPPTAAENLIAGSELALTFSRSQVAPAVVANKPDVPKNLTELLAAKRSLLITNPPDLNVLLSDIQTEIRDQYLEMPFEFNIRLMGNDLKEEGITQNQRPGELNIVDKSLSDILTQVMASANPNRNISGPADPDCKLVWVVADDPENESQKAVLITTRKAAEEKGYELPPAFVSE